MKLINLKCANCGAILEIENDAKKAKCSYCNTTTLIDDEVLKIEHKIVNGEVERKLNNALTYLHKLKKYKDAKKEYLELSKTIPDDPIVWKGIIMAETEKFSKMCNFDEDNSIDFVLIEDSFESYKAVEKDKKLLNEFQEEYKNYIKRYNEAIDQEIDYNTTDIAKKIIGKVLLFIITIIIAIILFQKIIN